MFRTKNSFVEYSELLLNFLTKFAQLLSIFNDMNESYQNSANIRQFFQVILKMFTLNISGFLQNLMRKYEILKTLMKVYDIPQSKQNFLGIIIHSLSFICDLLC